MEKFTEYFDNDYPMDTTIEYINTGHYSMLNCSFTSEDEDAGTETIHSIPAVPPKSREQMAYEMCQKLTNYMDLCDQGLYSEIDVGVRMEYDDYMESTKIAVERALQAISANYDPVVRNGVGNEVMVLSVKDAAKVIRDRIAKNWNVRFDFACSSSCGEVDDDVHKAIAHDYDFVNYGIKRIDNDYKLFDGNGSFDTDYILLVGLYGGGNIAMAYFCSDDYEHISDWDCKALINAMCESADIKPEEKILLEIIEPKEGEANG